MQHWNFEKLAGLRLDLAQDCCRPSPSAASQDGPAGTQNMAGPPPDGGGRLGGTNLRRAKIGLLLNLGSLVSYLTQARLDLAQTINEAETGKDPY
jgi:hypothetical protein